MIAWLICRLFHGRAGCWMDTESVGFSNRSMTIHFACRKCKRTWSKDYGP